MISYNIMAQYTISNKGSRSIYLISLPPSLPPSHLYSNPCTYVHKHLIISAFHFLSSTLFFSPQCTSSLFTALLFSPAPISLLHFISFSISYSKLRDQKDRHKNLEKRWESILLPYFFLFPLFIYNSALRYISFFLLLK